MQSRENFFQDTIEEKRKFVRELCQDIWVRKLCQEKTKLDEVCLDRKDDIIISGKFYEEAKIKMWNSKDQEKLKKTLTFPRLPLKQRHNYLRFF